MFKRRSNSIASRHFAAPKIIDATYRRALRFETLEDRRMLAVLTVDTPLDTVNLGDGLLSLREAIFVANTVAGADTIQFDFGHDGPETILLTQGELVITDSLVIEGLGAELLKIDAQEASRLFNIDDGGLANDFDVTIVGLTLTGGQSGINSDGGAIQSLTTGTLTIRDSAIRDNNTATITSGPGLRGGGIFAVGDVILVQSTISGNFAHNGGGGVYALGDIELLRSTIIVNHAARRGGGGIHGRGDVTLNDSTVSENSTGTPTSLLSNGGGGIFAFGIATLNHSTVSGNATFGNALGHPPNSTGGLLTGGGGIAAWTGVVLHNSTVSNNSTNGDRTMGGGIFGTATLNSSTVSGNRAIGDQANGGGIASGGIALNHSTVTENSADGVGGGIWVFVDFTMDHSILAGNSAGLGNPDVWRYYYPSTLAYSLIGNASGTPFAEAPVGSPDANGNLIGGPIHGVIDPMLGPLADNGGPTPTHALLPGSPAINAGDLNAQAGVDGVPLYDQRGEPFDRIVGGRIDIGAFEYQEPSDLDLLVDTLVDESDGDYSRGDLSLREAIELANANDCPNVVDTIHFDPSLSGGTILLTMGELVITDSLVIEGLVADLLTIDASGNDPTPDENNGDGSRVFAISDNDSSTLIDVEISGLTLTGGDLNLNQSPDFPNGHGGAIKSSERLSLTAVHIIGNFALRGGGVASANAPLTIVDSLISGNTALGRSGGGIYASGEVNIVSSRIIGNTSSEGGGILFNVFAGPGHLQIRGSTISGNSGGAIWAGIGMGSVLLEDTIIAENTSGSRGGGIFVSNVNGDFTIRRTTIRDNTGGGITAFDRGGTFLMEESLVSDNTAIANPFGIGSGGGMDLIGSDSSTFTIRNSTVAGNTVTFGPGGGINVTRGHLTLESATVSGNSASDGGGIASSNRALLTIRHSTITANTGGGIWGNVTLDHTIVAGNQDEGGASLDVAGVANAQYSLVGFGAEYLGPLADNGGPTPTHALLHGSPAIDAGDPNAMAGIDGVPTHDQRGAPFIRVYGGRIDIGAVEWMPEGFLPGDFNGDGKVSAGDSTIWMDTLHSTADLRADANGDGVVDYADREIWMANFGLTTDALPPVEGAAVGSSSFLEGVVDETNQSTIVSNQESAPGRSRLVEAVFHEFGSRTVMNRRLLPISTAPHSERSKDLLLLADIPRDHAFAGDHWRASRSIAAEVQDIATDFGWDSFPDAEYELAAVLPG